MKKETSLSPRRQTNRRYLRALKVRIAEAWGNLSTPKPIQVTNKSLTIESQIDIATLFEGIPFDLVDRDHGLFLQSFALKAMRDESKMYYLGTYLLEYCRYFESSMAGEEEEEYECGFGLSCVDMWGFALFSSLPVVWKMHSPPPVHEIVSEVISGVFSEGSVAAADASVIAEFNSIAGEILASTKR